LATQRKKKGGRRRRKKEEEKKEKHQRMTGEFWRNAVSSSLQAMGCSVLSREGKEASQGAHLLYCPFFCSWITQRESKTFVPATINMIRTVRGKREEGRGKQNDGGDRERNG